LRRREQRLGGARPSRPDSPLLTVFADADGRYSVCGIPPNWQVAFDVGQSGYVGRYDWHEFTGDATVDVELQRH